MKKQRTVTGATPGEWTFLSNHGHVLLAIAREPASRIRDIAQQVGITERSVLRIISELKSSKYLSQRRNGRRNCYRVYSQRPLRHPVERHQQIASLLALVLKPAIRGHRKAEP